MKTIALFGAGRTLAYHHHMGTVVQTKDEVERLMDSCDELERSLNCDSSFLDAVPGDGCVDCPAVAPSAEYANLCFRNLHRFAQAKALT